MTRHHPDPPPLQVTAYPANLTYSWAVNGLPVAGEESESLVLEELARQQDGALVQCSVTNSVGRGEASHALVVRHGPTITSQPEGVVVR